ncbi:MULTISPECIES: hypothetical protein [unclassified Vibrio]|uniref:hypothetical protein n=1 Tax=unclassified Vibrio TaxID=2614977 RepID=UPI001361E980|nr:MULTISPECIES: hypothetical protein [unclassified Vibrio]NAW56247.1 hypothetical protein [Vibrio sp. V36_P2S2PM302]NAX23520.1 hypothetical protein [Vibrio sp. V39_P1S14PM300]NAX27410.1 hypothetical protein [Vibrio sp. V38_P2S17PM301]
MEQQQALYRAFYQAQDRFLDPYTACGFEPDIICNYVHCGLLLTSYYEYGAEHQNPLLCELFLRQVYFHLLDGIDDTTRSRVFRQICLDAVHTPLLCLKRFYDHISDGDIKFLSLKQELQRLNTPL